ncbi:MAG TPA: ABATE domain-containing protein [Terriglobales bacterium]
MGKLPMPSESVPRTHDFQSIGGNLALDFINTVGNRLGSSREYLTSVAEVTRWARLVRLIPKRRVLSITGSHLALLIVVREELYELFRPVATGSQVSPTSLERLNRRLREVSPRHQIVRGVGGFRWTWDTDISRPEYLLGPVLLDAVDLLTSGRFAKIRQCSDEACGWLFLDRSQAGKRRWCRMADCGNRYKARRYYRRKQAG